MLEASYKATSYRYHVNICGIAGMLLSPYLSVCPYLPLTVSLPPVSRSLYASLSLSFSFLISSLLACSSFWKEKCLFVKTVYGNVDIVFKLINHSEMLR